MHTSGHASYDIRLEHLTIAAPPSAQVRTDRDVLLKRVDSRELREVLSRVEVHGGAYAGRRLEVEDLVRLGMEPNYSLKIGGRTVYLAGQLYALPSSRLAIVGYVQDVSARTPGRDIYTVRSYYRSNSQGGSWRYLPSALVFGDRIGLILPPFY